MMNRRHFLRLGLLGAGMPLAGRINGVSWAATPTASDALVNAASPYRNLLILIELKGANDGLNTVIP